MPEPTDTDSTDDVLDLDEDTLDGTESDHQDDEPAQVDDDLDDVTADDYATAAEQLAQEAAEAQGDTTEPDEDAEPDGTPREARYRRRAREAEAEVDRLAGLVEGMRRSEIERLAAGKLADPSDLFRDGATVADVLDDQGRVDAGKLDAVLDRLLVEHPHWRAEPPRYTGPLYSGASSMRQADAPAKSFVDAFGPTHKTE